MQDHASMVKTAHCGRASPPSPQKVLCSPLDTVKALEEGHLLRWLSRSKSKSSKPANNSKRSWRMCQNGEKLIMGT